MIIFKSIALLRKRHCKLQEQNYLPQYLLPFVPCTRSSFSARLCVPVKTGQSITLHFRVLLKYIHHCSLSRHQMSKTKEYTSLSPTFRKASSLFLTLFHSPEVIGGKCSLYFFFFPGLDIHLCSSIRTTQTPDVTHLMLS